MVVAVGDASGLVVGDSDGVAIIVVVDIAVTKTFVRSGVEIADSYDIVHPNSKTQSNRINVRVVCVCEFFICLPYLSILSY